MPKVQRRAETTRRNNGRQQQGGASGGSSHGSSSSDAPSDGIPKLNGCPVLDPIDCQCPKVEVGEDGVMMICTSEPCPFSNIPLHPECYQLLEDNLVRRLATLGSARGWTVPQRRNNLWEKKGQALIGRYCRCRCGHGQMTRDKQAMYEKEKAVEKEKKKKAKKTKQLPQLQFNSKPSAVQEDKKANDFQLASSLQPRSSISTTRSRLITDRSTTSMRTIDLFDMMSESSVGECSSRYNNNNNRHADSDTELAEEDIPEIREKPVLVVPAPPPPPQKKSYAATIKNELTVTVEPLRPLRSEDISPLADPTSPSSGPQHSPDSGLHQSPRSCSQEERGLGDFTDTITQCPSESYNPLGLSLFSPIQSSTPGTPGDVFFPDLVATPPPVPRTESLLVKLAGIRAKKEMDLPKPPLATSTPMPSVSEENQCGIRFNAPVRQMMDFWTASNCSLLSGCGDASTKVNNTVKETVKDDVEPWTPMFGRGFNIGERLMYLP